MSYKQRASFMNDQRVSSSVLSSDFLVVWLYVFRFFVHVHGVVVSDDDTINSLKLLILVSVSKP